MKLASLPGTSDNQQRVAARRRNCRHLAVEPLEDRRLLASISMTAYEQLLLELVNRARLDPAGEAARYGIDLNRDLTPGTISATPKQPVAPVQALINATGAHSQEMLDLDYFSHTGHAAGANPGSSPTQRAAAAGYSAGVAENIGWYGVWPPGLDQGQAVYEVHEGLFLSAGHRVNLLGSVWNDAGAGVRFGGYLKDGTNWDAIMVTENFGDTGGDPYLTGVAYTDDVVADNFFTVGESLPDVHIQAVNTADGQVYLTTAGPSGGYAVRLPAGTYTVVAFDPDAGLALSAESVVIGTENEKLDFGDWSGAQPVDFGDAPDPGYATLLASDGARHLLDGAVYLGDQVDGELDGQPNETATGDADDGVAFHDPLVPDRNVVLTVTASATGIVDAWLDWDGNGHWDHPAEQFLVGEAVVGGDNQFTLRVPADANPGETFARFRISSTGGLAPTGWAADGEVEDYQVVIPPGAADSIGVRRDDRFVLDCDGSGNWTNGVDRTFVWGSASDTLLIGDWNGDGYDEIGVRQPDGRFLLDVDGSGNWTTGDRTYFWGQPEDEPFVGDWDGDGDDEIGVRQPDGRFLLDADGSGRWSAGDRTYFWSFPNDMVLIGDWDGDGDDEIGVRRTDGRFLLDVDGSGRWSAGDQTFFWGSPTDTVLIGDWDGDGDDTIGVRWADGRFVLDVDGSGRWSAGDRTFFWGSPGDTILTGDWDGDGDDTIGVRWPDGRYVLDVDGSGQWSAGDRTYFWGLTTDSPIVGNWASASPLMAAEPVAGGVSSAPLSDEALAPLVETAIAAWSSQSLSADQQTLLDQVHVQIADLPGLTLGQTVGTSITLDIDGAGWGWFIDATPDDDAEFVSGDQGSSTGSAQRMDLLTVLAHEMGHILGWGHDVDDDVMDALLPGGVRRLPSDAEFADAAFASAWDV